MNIRIQNASPDPIYLQIKNQLRDAILSGELSADEQLPSIRFLAKELRVSVITTKRAYDDLEAEGYIYSLQGKGSFVAEQNQELLREQHLRKMEEALQEALRLAKLAGLSLEELIKTLTWMEEEHELY